MPRGNRQKSIIHSHSTQGINKGLRVSQKSKKNKMKDNWVSVMFEICQLKVLFFDFVLNKWREIDSLILSSKELESRSLETDKKITKVCSTKREVKIISLPNSSCLKSERFRTSNFLKILTVDTRSQFQMNIHRHYQRNLTRVFNVCQKCQAILNKGFVLLSAFALNMLLKIWTHGYGFQNIRRFYNYDSFFFNFMKFSENINLPVI